MKNDTLLRNSRWIFMKKATVFIIRGTIFKKNIPVLIKIDAFPMNREMVFRKNDTVFVRNWAAV
jgi:hypothetical protein